MLFCSQKFNKKLLKKWNNIYIYIYNQVSFKPVNFSIPHMSHQHVVPVQVGKGGNYDAREKILSGLH